MKTAQTTILIGVLLAGLGVVIGAFGAHGLQELLKENGQLATFETAVKYQMYHALGLILLGLAQKQYASKLLAWAAKSMWVGTLIFSVSLYILSLTGIKWLGAITPLGGLAMLLAWALFFMGIYRQKQ